MAQLIAAVAEILRSFQDTRRPTDGMPSLPSLPLCTSEAYDAFVNWLSAYDAFTRETVKRLATVNGRNEKDFSRDLLYSVTLNASITAGAWTRACITCQRSKIQRHNKAPTGSFPGPGSRFRHVHLDIVGPLPLSNGYSYLLTCVRFTQWPEAIPLPDIAAPKVVRVFFSRWFAIFGAPSTITTGHGAQFECCTRIRTTAYHPTANGVDERFNRQLKASLRAADDPEENWTDDLPLVMLGIRSSLQSDLDCSAAEPVFGATVRLPGQMISPVPRFAVEDPTNLLHRLHQFLRTLSPVSPRPSVSKSYLEKDLATCSHVYLRCHRVRQPLEPPYDGPFRVISRGTKNFRIQRGTREEVVSVDRLKAAVPDTPLDEPCGSLPPAPSPPPSIPPSCIFPLPHVNDPQLQLPLHQPQTL
nr:unnamed protein product [Spirometra erinaceieuropaei]